MQLEDLEPPIPPADAPQPPGFGSGQDALAKYHADATAWRSQCAIYETEVRSWKRRVARWMAEQEAKTGQQQAEPGPAQLYAPSTPVYAPTDPVHADQGAETSIGVTTPIADLVPSTSEQAEPTDRKADIAILAAKANAWMAIPHHQAGDYRWHGGDTDFEWDGVRMDAPAFLEFATRQVEL